MVSIIIVNYKSEDLTIKFVKEELCKVVIPHQVIVVNNSATAESDLKLSKALNAEVIYNLNQEIDTTKTKFIVSEPDNLGFARGNNLGVLFSLKHFDVQFYLFSNNDLRFISNDVVEKLIAKLSELPNIGVIGPKIVGLDGLPQSPINYLSFFKKWFIGIYISPYVGTKLRKLIYGKNYNKFSEGIYYSLMGCFLIVKKDDFLKVGMFDSNTFLYGEEVILAERMALINKKCYFLPSVEILHEHDQTIGTYFSDYSKFKMQFKNDIYYFKTHRNLSLINQYFCWITVNIKYFIRRLIKK